MCGGSEADLHDPRRYGALAVLNPSLPLANDNSTLSGQVVFFNEMDHRSQMATHISFTPRGTERYHDGLILTIFSTGDLTIPSAKCTQLKRFTLPNLPSRDTGYSGTTHSKLAQDLLLQVGGDGIIGRRISISSTDFPSFCIAEGIVGFNNGAIPPRSTRI